MAAAADSAAAATEAAAAEAAAAEAAGAGAAAAAVVGWVPAAETAVEGLDTIVRHAMHSWPGQRQAARSGR